MFTYGLQVNKFDVSWLCDEHNTNKDAIRGIGVMRIT